MPKAEFCPVCNSRMKRLYEREREGYHGTRSKFWGYLWLCPNRHVVIVEHRKSKTQEIYGMQEVLA